MAPIRARWPARGDRESEQEAWHGPETMYAAMTLAMAARDARRHETGGTVALPYGIPMDALLGLIGSSPAIDALRGAIRKLSAHGAAAGARLPTVLVTGETGTGKAWSPT
jgi:DNA-binding NtrC family response regulator